MLLGVFRFVLLLYGIPVSEHDVERHKGAQVLLPSVNFFFGCSRLSGLGGHFTAGRSINATHMHIAFRRDTSLSVLDVACGYPLFSIVNLHFGTLPYVTVPSKSHQDRKKS